MATRVRSVRVEAVAPTGGTPLPFRATPGSAGYDLVSAEDVQLRRGSVALVRTGLRMRAPPGTFLEIRPRSGLATKGVVMANAPGTIDRDYAGEIAVPLTFLLEGTYDIRAGDRIAQVRLVEDLPTRFRIGRVPHVAGRDGGFGSTGR